MERYRLLERLGKGGMAEVFLADDLVLERQVALKFLSPELAADPEAQERLHREARAAAALDHPFICTVFDTGRLDGRPFIAMEYVRGRTLRARLDQGPMAPADARETALAMATALAAAHRLGIVHRDLKPANIMLTEQGHVKVMDFGLARRVDSAAVDGAVTTVGAMTAPGVRLGTPAYMSPEQVLGADVGAASDVFSFGIVLTEMLGASHPFLRATPAATMAAIVRDRPTPPANWPRAIRDLVDGLLAKSPDDRPSFDRVCASGKSGSRVGNLACPSVVRENVNSGGCERQDVCRTYFSEHTHFNRQPSCRDCPGEPARVQSNTDSRSASTSHDRQHHHARLYAAHRSRPGGPASRPAGHRSRCVEP